MERNFIIYVDIIVLNVWFSCGLVILSVSWWSYMVFSGGFFV